MYSALLHTILSKPWAIDQSVANAYLPLIRSYINGQSVTLMPPTQPYTKQLSHFIALDGLTPIKPTPNQQPPSQLAIAVINMSGVLLKADTADMCSQTIGMASLGSYINEMDADDNVQAIILVIDSPGGTVDGTKTLAELISACTTPVYALVDGMCCSAAYWIASACHQIYSAQTTDVIGSVGTMIAFADTKPALEKEGVKFYELYADAATEKNGKFNALLNDNNSRPLIDGMLNPLNDMFVTAVKTNRGARLQADAAGVLSGETYLSEIALANGMIDGIMTMNNLINHIVDNYNQKQKTDTVYYV